MTVRLIVLLFERALIQLLQAVTAYEMLWMKFSCGRESKLITIFRELAVLASNGILILTEHGRDASAGDRLVAARAQRALLCVKMRLAIGFALVFEESARNELAAAVRTDKAPSMPLAI